MVKVSQVKILHFQVDHLLRYGGSIIFRKMLTSALRAFFKHLKVTTFALETVRLQLQQLFGLYFQDIISFYGFLKQCP